MKEFFRKCGYYSIFFFLSGIVHYQLCFNYTECLVITPEISKIAPGASLELKVDNPIKPQNDLQDKVVWKISNPAAGSMDSKGRFTAGKEAGEVEVIAYQDNIMGTAKIYIEKPKIAAMPPALVQALKNAPQEAEKKAQEEKKEEPKKDDPKKEEKPPVVPEPEKEEKKDEKKIYQENLEKLQQQLQAKMEELEKQKKEELDKLKKELTEQKQKEVEEIQKKMEELQKKKMEEMELAQQKKMQELDQEKEKQKSAQQELVKKMEEVSRRMAEMDQQKKQDMESSQEKEKKFQETLSKKIQEIKQENQQEIAKLKQENQLNMELAKQNYQNQLEEKNRESQRLSNTIAEMRKDQQKTLQEIKTYKSEQSDKQKELEKQQKDLENKIADLMTKGKSSSVNQNSSQERTLVNEQWQYLEQIKANNLGEHDRLVQKFSTNFDQGTVVPALDFFDSEFKKNLYDIMSFHKMKLIAYTNGQYYISIQLNENYGNSYEKRTDFENFQKTYSNRSISAEHGFPHIIREIRTKSQVYRSEDGAIQLALIFPHKTADYIAWKTITVCKKFGYDPKDVAICSAYFQKTKTGYWSLIIKALRLKNGQKVFVQDFEENW